MRPCVKGRLSRNTPQCGSGTPDRLDPQRTLWIASRWMKRGRYAGATVVCRHGVHGRRRRRDRCAGPVAQSLKAIEAPERRTVPVRPLSSCLARAEAVERRAGSRRVSGEHQVLAADAQVSETCRRRDGPSSTVGDCAAQCEVLEGFGAGLCSAVMGRGDASCRRTGGDSLQNKPSRANREMRCNARASCEDGLLGVSRTCRPYAEAPSRDDRPAFTSRTPPGAPPP